MDKKTFYITTTLPYVNAEPHVGFAMELIRADVIARYKKLLGFDVFFNTGTDEHGQKLVISAEKEGMSVKEYVDQNAEKFRGLKELLSISDDVHFIRTTDEHHEKSAQEFWRRCDQNGYIYKKNYEAKYCVGCELEKTDSELDESGQCPLHPGKELEIINEENYFFKFSEFQKPLLEFYEKNPNFVVPDFRFNEIKAFVGRGLQDFSISRQKSKMSWGVPVPGDDNHVMYVWFDALVNYISTLGWPENKEQFEKFWINGTPIQYCGKDNLRQQSAMWQAMLLGAELPNSHQIVINGFLSGEGGVKMSKSLGNVINPYDIVKEYGTDALRFFLLSEVSSFEDSPFTMERFKDSYNAKLANGIGNLTSRIMKMTVANSITIESSQKNAVPYKLEYERYENAINSFDISLAFREIDICVGLTDAFIQSEEPFKKIKNPETRQKAKKDVQYLITCLNQIANMLKPLLPKTSNTILDLVLECKMPEVPLFLRKD